MEGIKVGDLWLSWPSSGLFGLGKGGEGKKKQEEGTEKEEVEVEVLKEERDGKEEV